MTQALNLDYLDCQYACVKCFSKFLLRDVSVQEYTEDYPYGMACPTCHSGQGLHVADGTMVVLDAYYGERGTLQ